MTLQQTDELSLHIRVVGHWTSKLYEYFEAEQKRLEFTMNGETPEVSTEQDLPFQSDECTELRMFTKFELPAPNSH